MIHYLLKNSNSKILHKFHFCCKSLFIQQKIAIIKKLEFCSSISESFYDSDIFSISITTPSDGDEKLDWLPKIFVLNELKVTVEGNRKFFSNIISMNLYRFEAKSIYVENQDLTFQEFKALLSKNVKFIKMKDCKILNHSNGEIREFVKSFPSLLSFLQVFTCENCKTETTSVSRPYTSKDQLLCSHCWEGYCIRHRYERHLAFK